MVKVSIEVRSGAACFDVGVQAESIQQAVSFVEERTEASSTMQTWPGSRSHPTGCTTTKDTMLATKRPAPVSSTPRRNRVEGGLCDHPECVLPNEKSLRRTYSRWPPLM